VTGHGGRGRKIVMEESKGRRTEKGACATEERGRVPASKRPNGVQAVRIVQTVQSPEGLPRQGGHTPFSRIPKTMGRTFGGLGRFSHLNRFPILEEAVYNPGNRPNRFFRGIRESVMIWPSLAKSDMV